MKYWHILVVFLVGAIITIIGALFKIMHWPGASLMLMAGMAVKVISLVLLIVKIVQNKSTSGFLNR